MSRSQILRYFVAMGLLIICISGCQHAHKTERSLSSYRFVDTTTKGMVGGTEKLDFESALMNVLHSDKCNHPGEEKKVVQEELPEVVTTGNQLYLTVTAYCPCATCCGWKLNRYGNPVYNYGPKRGSRKRIGYTSRGSRADIGTIAADPRAIPYGTRLEVPGYGFGIIEDTGGALKGNHVDIFFHSHREAMKWGVKRILVNVWPPAKTN